MLERADVRTGQDMERKQGNKGTYMLERTDIRTKRKQANKGHLLSIEGRGCDWSEHRKKERKKVSKGHSPTAEG